jgi:hypothetical protein
LAVNSVGYAQNDTPTSKKTKIQKTTFSCPIHPAETSIKEGECSKCGMKLVKNTLSKHNQAVKGSPTTPLKEKVYVCTMCKEVTSIKSGKCPKCGMDMILKEGEKAEHNHQH